MLKLTGFIFILTVAWSLCYSFHTRLVFQKRQSTALSMGRAAAVRAATKARTDNAKENRNRQYSRKIMLAIKAGGLNPYSNSGLAQVIADAKANNVPKEVIQRNIDKATSTPTEDYKEVMYEYFGPGGAGIIVNALTDNTNRMKNDLNSVTKKHPLKLANLNSVACKFDKKARIDVKSMITEEFLTELCISLDIDDFTLHDKVSDCPLNPQEPGQCVVYVNIPELGKLRDALRDKGYELSTSFAHIPNQGFIQLNDADFEANMAAITALEELDDVDFVEHNIDMTSED